METESIQAYWVYENGDSFWGFNVVTATSGVGLCATKEIHNMPKEQRVEKYKELLAAKIKADEAAAAKAAKAK